jgi:hypothetical protein
VSPVHGKRIGLSNQASEADKADGGEQQGRARSAGREGRAVRVSGYFAVGIPNNSQSGTSGYADFSMINLILEFEDMKMSVDKTSVMKSFVIDNATCTDGMDDGNQDNGRC